MVSDEYRVNYSEITKIYRNERKEPLAEIPPDFYVKARAYIEELRKESTSAPGTDYSSSAMTQIRETVKLLRHIWEFRTRKLLLLAVSQRKQEDYEIRGLADEEREFLASARKLVSMHEDNVLVASGEKVPPPPAVGEASGGREERDAPGSTGDAAHAGEGDAHAGDAHAPQTGDATAGGRMILIRFVADVPEFTTEFGSIRAARGDVANLPERYAKILLERQAAVRIDVPAA
jgi:DNA replication initiation complex subunit (GINS family)